MGLQRKGTPDPIHLRGGSDRAPGHFTRAPIRSVSRLLLERLDHDRLDPIVADGAGSPAARLIAKAV